MAATWFNITDIEIGTTFSMDVAVTDVSGAPFDLTSYTPTCVGKAAPTDVTPTITFTCSKPSAGVIRLDLSDDATSLLTPHKAFYRLLITDAGAGVTYPVLKGYATVEY